MVFIAMILPGNQTLPVVDLLAIPYMVQALVCLSNGNIAKTLLNGMLLVPHNQLRHLHPSTIHDLRCYREHFY
jgi:galactitol-specific phosphotransferase system IIC component